ncbi:sensor histidine kinase [Salinibacterium sp. SWN167]|uniref:sensor histidine kinase n=1 Tax=Salinibacterium sp. SWN167 TaxID=2792054 RepID=UPI0018CE0FF8|nr:histidine kinase [Salinibacterium sp. SWN167]MBH0083664.1 sensor histidine kinase [Salinibacterium sp. SWN167]
MPDSSSDVHSDAHHPRLNEASSDAPISSANPQPSGYRPRINRWDVVLAVGMLVGTLLSTVLTRIAGIYDEPADSVVTLLWAAGITLPLLFRRQQPLAVVIVISVVFMVGATLHVPEVTFCNIALFIALYSVGVWESRRRIATITRIVIIIAMFVWLSISIAQTTTDPDALSGLSRAGAFSPLLAYLVIQFMTNVLYFGGAYYFGERAFRSRVQQDALHERSVELVRERELLAAQAVTIERLRIARELHDVVAHHVSIMGVQAAAARTVLTQDPPAASQALHAVESGSRAAIDEMHRLLGTLRDADSRETATAAASTLGVHSIDELIDTTRTAGMPTRFEQLGEPRALSASTSVTLYRVTQEALTNARKHAGPAGEADVRLRWSASSVEIEIGNSGRAPSKRPSTGLGLIGMAERVNAVGGTLELRPRSRGGFLVRAELPLHADATEGRA